MKFIQSIAATTLVMATSAPVLAASVSADLYGKVNISLQDSDGQTELKSNASRIGIKGSTSLNDNLEVFYTYEFQVDPSDESGSSNLKSRNQFVGLRGAFGEVVVGRNDSILKQSQGKFDLYSDQEADIKVLWKGENRMSDSLTYKSPKFNGFQLGLGYYLDEDNDDAGTSVSVSYGDSALKKGKYYAAIAMDNELKGYNVTRLTVGTKVADVKLGVMLQTQENIADGSEKDGFLVSAQYKLGNYNLKGQFQTAEDDNGFTFGAERKLGKNTKLYAFYTSFNFDSAEDESYLALGLEHKF